MENAMVNLIGWFVFIGILLMLFSTNVIVVVSVIISWTFLIGIFMIGKIVNKGNKKCVKE